MKAAHGRGSAYTMSLGADTCTCWQSLGRVAWHLSNTEARSSCAMQCMINAVGAAGCIT